MFILYIFIWISFGSKRRLCQRKAVGSDKSALHSLSAPVSSIVQVSSHWETCFDLNLFSALGVKKEPASERHFREADRVTFHEHSGTGQVNFWGSRRVFSKSQKSDVLLRWNAPSVILLSVSCHIIQFFMFFFSILIINTKIYCYIFDCF